MRRLLVCLVTVAVVQAAFADAGAADTASDRQRAQARANQAAADFAAAQTSLAVSEDAAATTQARLESAQAELGGARRHLEALALRAYLRGGVDVLPLSTTDVVELSRGRALLKSVALSTADAIEQAKAAKTKLEDLRDQRQRGLEQRRAALAAVREQQRRAVSDLERLATLERADEARQAAAATTSTTTSTTIAAAFRSATTLVATTPTLKPPTTSPPSPQPGTTPSGSWTCPVQGPHSFSNDYGAPRGGGSTHEGNDILAARGTKVVANVAGTVQQHPNNLGGLAYYLHGDDGKEYYGAHLDSYGVSGRVAIGTVIGYVGNSGDASGGPTHLHFEIHEGGVAVNPYPTLVKYC
jgi:murein DD-endopeptidase MepM/ murein hydrolase activator NlpD